VIPAPTATVIADIVAASYALRRGVILTRFGRYGSATDYSCLTPTTGPGRLHPLELLSLGTRLSRCDISSLPLSSPPS
jgi:hypothetical protein